MADVYKESAPRNPIIYPSLHTAFLTPSLSNFLNITPVKSGANHSGAWK